MGDGKTCVIGIASASGLKFIMKNITLKHNYLWYSTPNHTSL